MNVLKDVITFWKDTWREDKLLFWMEALGTALGMAAAVILNVWVTNPIMLVVLSLYLVSAVMLCYGGYKRQSSFIMLLMAFYTLTSVFGLINLFL